MKDPGRDMDQAKSRNWALAGYVFLLALVIGGLQALDFTPFVLPELKWQDYCTISGKMAKQDPRLVFVGMDKMAYDGFTEEDLQNSEVLRMLQRPYPWSRKVWAALIDRLCDAGAQVIVFDILFLAESPDDPELADALLRHRDKVVIASRFTQEEDEHGGSKRGWYPPATTLIPGSLDAPSVLDERVGFDKIWLDTDKVNRRAYFTSELEERSALKKPMESLAARALRKSGYPQLIPTSSQRIRYVGPPLNGFIPYSVADIFIPQLWKGNFKDGEFFRDKIILVGASAPEFQDFHSTPFPDGMMPGPEIHLNFINAALTKGFVRELPSWMMMFFAALAGMLAWWLCHGVQRALLRLALGGAISVGYVGLAFSSYNWGNVFIPVVGPLLVLNLCLVGALAYDYFFEQIARLKLRTTMGYYFSPRVLEEVLLHPGAMEPRQADVTLLLTDLRNSTPLAEKLGPHGMFKLLNQVFEVQTAAIMAEEGNLEHFLGDQFLSYWGAPQAQADAVERAVRAAMTLVNGMENVRRTLTPEVAKLFGYGVAVHCGSVLVGNKGSHQRLDYGLVGDTVNEAARIEALTKTYGAQLLISADAFAKLPSPPPSRLVDRVMVKGKTTMVELHELQVIVRPENSTEVWKAYESAMTRYFAGQFAEAKSSFDELVRQYHDGPSRALAEHCEHFIENPPSKWDGIWRFETK